MLNVVLTLKTTFSVGVGGWVGGWRKPITSWLNQEVQACTFQFGSRFMVRYPVFKIFNFLVPGKVSTLDFLVSG